MGIEPKAGFLHCRASASFTHRSSGPQNAALDYDHFSFVGREARIEEPL
jgi:hypothetical protein